MADRFDVYNAYRNDLINFDQARFLLSRLDGELSMEEIDEMLDHACEAGIAYRASIKKKVVWGFITFISAILVVVLAGLALL